MKTIILTLITLLVGTLLFSQTPEPRYGILTPLGNPHTYTVDQIVPAGQTLTIRAGVVLEFENAKLIVEGQLFAFGSDLPDSLIIFKSTVDIPDHMPAEHIDPNTPSFNGIEFAGSGASGSRLDYVVFSTVINSTAVRITNSSDINITNSTFTKMKDMTYNSDSVTALGIYNSSDIQIQNNNFIDSYILAQNHTPRSVVYVNASSSVSFIWNTFGRNTAPQIFHADVFNLEVPNNFIKSFRYILCLIQSHQFSF